VTGVDMVGGKKLLIEPSVITYYLIDDLEYPLISDHDASADGLDILKDMQEIYDSNKAKSKVVKKTDKLRDVVVSDQQYENLKTLHSTEFFAGHPGAERLFVMYKRQFPESPISMEQAVKYVRSCPDCQRERRRKYAVQNKAFDPKPIGSVQIDTFQVKNRLGVWITFLTIVCLATGMVAMYKLLNDSALETCKKLLQAQQTFPFRDVEIGLDKGTNFIAELTQAQIKLLRGSTRFGITNSHTDQAYVESVQGRVRYLIRPYMEQIAAETDGDEVEIAIPICCATLNSMPDVETGISPLDVFSPVNSSEFPLLDLPDGQTIEDKAAMVSLIFELQTRFLDLMYDKYKAYLAKKKYKANPDDYPNSGDLVMIQYENRPSKDRYRNYGPFWVVETIEIDGIPYAVLKDLNNMMKEPFKRALSECVKYFDDPRNMRPAEVAARGSDFTIVEAITDHTGNPRDKKSMTFTVQWLGGAVTVEPYSVVRQLQALDDYILALCEGGNPELEAMLDKKQREEVRRNALATLAQVRVETWLPRAEQLYITEPLGDTDDDLKSSPEDELFSKITFIENGNTPEQMHRLKTFIKDHIQIFTSPSASCRVKVEPMVEKYTSEPPWEAARKTRNPVAMAQEIKAIDRRVELGMLEPARSTKFNTPLHNALDSIVDAIPKYRVTVDTSRRKQFMIRQEMAPGTLSLEDTLASVDHSTNMSVMDMDKCFYQWTLAEESRDQTTFTDSQGRRWRSTVLEMGSPNSVTWVQTQMRSILSSIPLVPYVDDIPIGNQGGSIPDDWERKSEDIPVKELPFEHMFAKVVKLVTIAEKMNLRFNPEKTIFNAAELTIVGRKTGHGRTALDDGTKERIRGLEHPRNLSALASAVGSLQWTRPFVPKLSVAIAKWKRLLGDPVGKNLQVITVSPESTDEFNKIKEMVADCRDLYPLNEDRVISVDADASPYGYGGLVYHIDDYGEKQIILVVSGSFDKVQSKWAQAEHEAFGVMKVITTAAPILLGRHFILNTDARNLTFLSSDTSKKIYRWFLQLLPYHFDIRHIPAKYNQMADDLSRM